MTSRKTGNHKSGNKVAPTSTALQARLLIYQASQRPQTRQGDWIATAHGRCRVTGRLGQRHADLLEATMYCAEKIREIADGGVELLVDPARIRSTMSDGHYSLQRTQKLFAEMRAAVIEIEPAGGLPSDRIIGGLVDHVVPSTATRHDPLTGGTRQLWRVRLGVALVTLLDRDVKLYRDPAPIARLAHGISQAVARYVFSHKRQPQGGWKLETIIGAVSDAAPGSKARRNARARLHNDADALAGMGIIIDDGRVTRCCGRGKSDSQRPGSDSQRPGSDSQRPDGDSQRPDI